MKEKDKKKPFKFSINLKEWDNTKAITYSSSFKHAEKSYFIINKKYSSLHKMYIHEKEEAEIVFEQIYKVIEALKVVDTVAPKLGMRLIKVKNTEKEFRMSDRQTKKIEKMEKDFNYLTRTKGLRASVAIEIIAKKIKSSP